VLLIEPQEIGVGVHWRNQPDYLKLNTVAGQATAFTDGGMAPGAPILRGPTFLQWCEHRGESVETAAGTLRPVREGDFVPRRMWGDYLAWSAEHMLAQVPPWVTVRIHVGEAIDVQRYGGCAAVTLDDTTTHHVDLAFVATGHGVRGRDSIACFPLPAAVAEILPGSRVAISGMGLTAVDVVATLTVGRGGRFHGDDANPMYRRGGAEPTIILFNRTGHLPCARPTRPRTAPKTDARRFTATALRERRREHPGGRLDFFTDVLPLIRAEILDRDLPPEQRQLAESVLALRPQRHADSGDYVRSVLARAECDLGEAQRGLDVSEFKDAMESLRDLRQTLREVVYPPGLTPVGHRDFFATVPNLANRAVVGPDPQSLRRVLALVASGVVEFGPGPAPSVRRTSEGCWVLMSTHLDLPSSTTADHLVEAHLDFPPPISSRNALLNALRLWAAPHPADSRYLQLTADGQVIVKDGEVAAGVVVLGPPAEGANYYNNYVLWPDVPSPLVAQIDRIVASAMDLGSDDSR
jgi:hypothetical protein